MRDRAKIGLGFFLVGGGTAFVFLLSWWMGYSKKESLAFERVVIACTNAPAQGCLDAIEDDIENIKKQNNRNYVLMLAILSELRIQRTKQAISTTLDLWRQLFDDDGHDQACVIALRVVKVAEQLKRWEYLLAVLQSGHEIWVKRKGLKCEVRLQMVYVKALTETGQYEKAKHFLTELYQKHGDQEEKLRFLLVQNAFLRQDYDACGQFLRKDTALRIRTSQQASTVFLIADCLVGNESFYQALELLNRLMTVPHLINREMVRAKVGMVKRRVLRIRNRL